MTCSSFWLWFFV